MLNTKWKVGDCFKYNGKYHKVFYSVNNKIYVSTIQHDEKMSYRTTTIIDSSVLKDEMRVSEAEFLAAEK